MGGFRFGAGFPGWSPKALVCAGLLNCGSSEVRGVALYPPDPPRTRSDVALLVGPVETVDGQNVGARGPLLELLPGCHVVEIGDRIGHIGESESLLALTHSRVYAFRMRAGHTYRIEVARDAVSCSGPRSSCMVAREENRHGYVAFVPVAMSAYDLAACRQWVP